MKTYDITKRLSKQAKEQLNRIVATHDKYKGSYFWKSATYAGQRRSNESKFEKNNPDVCFLTKHGRVEVKMSYSESCKNVYYSLYVELDGETKNIRLIKKLLKDEN